MSGYTVNNEMAGTAQNLGTSAKTLIKFIQPTTLPRRVRIYEIEMSVTGVPNATDCPVVGDLLWVDTTTGGTASGTGVVPQPNDGGTVIGTQVDTAATIGLLNFSAEPTAYAVTHSWWYRAFNQRSGVLYQSIPGKEIVLPSVAGTAATTGAGAGLRALSPNYASTMAARMSFDEL